MLKVVHLIDRSTSADMLRQLSLLAAPNERIICVGSPPAAPWPGGPLERQHCMLDIPALALGLWRMNMVDVVHAWSPRAALAAFRMRADLRLLSVAHAPHNSAERRMLDGLLNEGLSITVPTEAARGQILSYTGTVDTVAVLSPCVASPADLPHQRTAVRAQLHLADSEVLLVTPAEMVRGAGHRYAAWVHAILRQMLPNVRLLMPGAGPQLERVRYFASTTTYDREIFLTLDRLSLADALAAADIALVPYEYDCGLHAVLAPMAAGLPTVASATADIQEVAAAADAPIVLTPPRSPRDLSAALLDMIEHKELATQRAAAAGERVADLFGPRRSRQQLDAIYSRQDVPATV